MARIQRTHHPIFAGSLETSTFSPVEGAAAPEISAADAAKGPPPQLEPSAEAVTQVNRIQICNQLPSPAVPFPHFTQMVAMLSISWLLSADCKHVRAQMRGAF